MVTKTRPAQRRQAKRQVKKQNADKVWSQKILSKVKYAIENNLPLPWQKPWNGRATEHQNAFTKHVYTGVNPFLIDIIGGMAYEDYRWIRYGQGKRAGASLKSGQYELGIDLYQPIIVKIEDEAEDGTVEIKNKIIGYSSFTVWNVEQWDNLDIEPLEPDTDTDFDPITEAEDVIKGIENLPQIRHDGGDRAFYVPATDMIHMPKRSLNTFHGTEEYYSTLFHEIAHSTGHESRLNVDTVVDSDHRKGKGYGAEELRAELTNMMVFRRLGINGTYDNSIAYLKSWYEAIEQDDKLFMRALLQALRAFKYIMGE